MVNSSTEEALKMKQGKIIESIVVTLHNNIVPGTTDDWTRDDWTNNILRELCTVGRDEFDCRVWTTGHPEGANGGGWLYDQTWTYPDSENWTKVGWSIPIVAECEWDKNLEKIQEDFEKLLQARADVRVMIIDAARWSAPKKIALELCNWVSLFKGSKKNDLYLIVAYEEKTKPWNWRFFVIQSKGFGKSAKLRDITP